jgi:hypothetical protein
MSSLSNVDNVSKTVYASTQGYRKKLGSSNIDREDRQSTGKFKLNERMNPMKFSENFELKKRGGYIDVVDAKSLITDEQLVANLKQVNKTNVIAMNKQVRNSQVGLAKVESNMNSALLSNLENAKVNSRMQNELIQENENFKNSFGGEVFYNALTLQKYRQRVEPGRLREGEFEDEESFNMYVVGKDIEKYKQEILDLAGVRTAKEYKELRGKKLPDSFIQSQENYIFNKSPFITSKKIEEYKQIHATKEERDAYEASLPDDPNEKIKSMSEASRNEPEVKDLPKNQKGQIDVTQYIKEREEKKLEDPKYKKENEARERQIEAYNKKDGKTMDKATLPPSQYKQEYRSDEIKFEPTEYHKSKKKDPKTGKNLMIADIKDRSNLSEKFHTKRKSLETEYLKIKKNEEERYANELTHYYDTELNMAIEEHLPPPHDD